jgi:hypothetical protein
MSSIKKILGYTFAVLAITSTVTTKSQAAFIPGWEKPIKKAEMEITRSKFGFSPIKKITVTLTRQIGSESENPTGMIVDILNSQTGKTTTEILTITRVHTDECGSIEYDASLPQQVNASLEDFETFRRFNMHLIDHTGRTCGGLPEDSSARQWEALIRQGHGFCGTMDATMTAMGNPEDLYTVATHE